MKGKPKKKPTDRDRAGREEKLMNELRERVKELNCFFGLAKLVEKRGITLDGILEGVCDLLPPACQYPDITCARIIFEGNEFKTDNYRKTRWTQTADIKAHRKNVGFVEVCYLKKKPNSQDGMFLREEKKLIKAVAGRLGRIIERQQAEGMLDEKIRELEEYQNKLEYMVEDRTRELAGAYDELKKADEVKDDFLAAVSHGLKTPVTSIIGLSQLLADELADLTNEEQKEDLSAIVHESKRLKTFVDDILDLSKLESGKVGFKMRRVRLGDLADEVVSDMRFKTNEKNLKLINKVPKNLPQVIVSDEGIQEVLINLIDNAIKFTPGGGTITLRAGKKEDRIVVRVTDTGAGIPEGDLNKIFDRFYQVESMLSNSGGGVGLGLAISKRIIESHGGSIWAESKEGEGSTFYFTLPYK